MKKKNFLLYDFIVIQFLFFIIFNSQIICSETVNNKDLILNIESPLEVNEKNNITVKILVNGTPVKDVLVILIDNSNQFIDQNYIKRTNISGIVQFNTPSLIYNLSNKTFSIVAIKVGFITNEKNIKIINIPNILFKEELTEYNCKEVVTITVINEISEPIENATMLFNGKTYYSDKDGKIILTMPRLKGLWQYLISKEGYVDKEGYIEIYGGEHPDYGPILGVMITYGIIILFITIVIISLFIIFYKILKKK